MIRLIQNELVKIFKKKSLYIAFLLIVIAIIFTSCMNRFSSHTNSYGQGYISNLEEMLSNLSPDNPSDTSTYIELKSELDQMKLIEKYGQDSWQATILSQEMRDLLMQLNMLQYGAGKDETKYQETKKQYDALIQKLEQDDWHYFATEQRKEIISQLEETKKQKETTIDKAQQRELEEKIAGLEVEKQVVDWRLQKNISYAKGEFNNMLLNYPRYQEDVRKYVNQQDDHQAKVNYQESLEGAKLIEYSIENEVNVRKTDDTRGVLLNFIEQNSIYILILVIMIAGAIISDEFNKGTVKLLLVRPYQRWKIVLAKFTACLITMFICIIALFVVQFITTSILFGLESLKTPAVVYNFTTGKIQTLPILGYLAFTLLAKLPMLILVMLIAFMLGGVFNNSALAIVIAFLGFMSSDMINMMATEYGLEWMKFFITPNWDLTSYLFGGIPQFQYTSFGFSNLMNLLYLVGMLGFTIYIFQKRNIKNI